MAGFTLCLTQVSDDAVIAARHGSLSVRPVIVGIGIVQSGAPSRQEGAPSAALLAPIARQTVAVKQIENLKKNTGIKFVRKYP